MSIHFDLIAVLGELLQKLQTGRQFDSTGWLRAQALATDCARLLKGQPMVPKALLKEIHVAARILRAEAPHSPRENEITQVADKLEWIFELILRDEAVEDRRPGVPRII
jgi:hypothetical protein